MYPSTHVCLPAAPSVCLASFYLVGMHWQLFFGVLGLTQGFFWFSLGGLFVVGFVCPLGAVPGGWYVAVGLDVFPNL